MASVDLKNAFYSVPVAKEHQKYLKFAFNGTPVYLLAKWFVQCPMYIH